MITTEMETTDQPMTTTEVEVTATEMTTAEQELTTPAPAPDASDYADTHASAYTNIGGLGSLTIFGMPAHPLAATVTSSMTLSSTALDQHDRRQHHDEAQSEDTRRRDATRCSTATE